MVTKCRADEAGQVTEGGGGEVGSFTEGHARELGAIAEDRAGEAGLVTEGRGGEVGTARREVSGVFLDFFPVAAPPLALRKICMVAEFEALEIDLIFRRFGKVDAREGHAHVFIGWIAPPCVPGALSLCRKVK
ncbi:MAG: hypothetical protein WA624_07025 [Methylocella sp.]